MRKQYAIRLPELIWDRLEEVARERSMTRAVMIQSELAKLAGMTFAEADLKKAQFDVKEASRVAMVPKPARPPTQEELDRREYAVFLDVITGLKGKAETYEEWHADKYKVYTDETDDTI